MRRTLMRIDAENRQDSRTPAPVRMVSTGLEAESAMQVTFSSPCLILLMVSLLQQELRGIEVSRYPWRISGLIGATLKASNSELQDQKYRANVADLYAEFSGGLVALRRMLAGGPGGAGWMGGVGARRQFGLDHDNVARA